MSVNLIFKIAAVGILVSVISQVLKHSGREEQAFLTSLAGLILVLFWITYMNFLNRSKDCLHCKRAVSAKRKGGILHEYFESRGSRSCRSSSGSSV